jgi:hypothetical protein
MSSSQPSNSQPLGTKPGATLTTTRAQSSGDVKELESTIAGFQAILSDDERMQLQQLKKTSHDPQSIITFTAELDRLDGKRRGRSVASRLASFLQTVEQFTPIIDTYIQSNPDIAALIWGSIKLTFMVRTSLCDYLRAELTIHVSVPRQFYILLPIVCGAFERIRHIVHAFCQLPSGIQRFPSA